VVKDEGDHKIALYFSSRRHAGENLDDVLERRSPSLPMPIKMSDAAAVNGKKRAQILALLARPERQKSPPGAPYLERVSWPRFLPSGEGAAAQVNCPPY